MKLLVTPFGNEQLPLQHCYRGVPEWVVQLMCVMLNTAESQKCRPFTVSVTGGVAIISGATRFGPGWIPVGRSRCLNQSSIPLYDSYFARTKFVCHNPVIGQDYGELQLRQVSK
jgi:hypothetical protein